MLSNYTIQRHVKLPPSRIVTSQNIPPNVNQENISFNNVLDNFHAHIVISSSDWNVAMISSSFFPVLKRHAYICLPKGNLHLDVPSATWKRAKRLLEAVLPSSQHRIHNELIVISILTVHEECLAILGIQLRS